MRYIVWGDKDKRVVYGNKNLRWGSPKSYLLEPGDPGYVELQPGEPGYVPPAPEPKKKPRRRSTLSPANLQPSNTTIAFEYVIIPNPKNPQRPFRARPVSGDQVSADQFLNDVAADSSFPRETVEKVLTSISKVTVANMRQNNSLAHVRWPTATPNYSMVANAPNNALQRTPGFGVQLPSAALVRPAQSRNNQSDPSF